MEKNSKKEKLDKIKTDLEIKLVKIELEKIKAQELELKKSVALKVENSKKEKEKKVEIKKFIPTTQVKKEKEAEIDKFIPTTQVKKEKEAEIDKFIPITQVKKEKEAEIDKFIPITQIKKEKEVEIEKFIPTTQVKKENKLDKVSVVKPTNQSKKNKQPQKVTIAKTVVKSNKISTPKKADSKPQKNIVKQQLVPKKKESKPSIKTVEKKKNNTKKIIAFVFIFIALIFTTQYLLNLKNKNQKLIQNEDETINFDSNNYYKEVDDEVSEDELQDFAVYKDIPEDSVLKNNATQDSENQTNNTIVNATTSEKNSATNTDNTKTNTILEKINSTNDETSLEDIFNDSETGTTNTQNESVETTKNNEELKINSIEKITIDYVNIIGLQFKNEKYSLPKKVKKTNAFKVRVRLNKFKKTNLITNNKTEVMLVVKNSKGKTIKIDVKEVDFSTTQKTYLTFQELLSTNVEIGKEYTFSFFANKKIIKISKHTF